MQTKILVISIALALSVTAKIYASPTDIAHYNVQKISGVSTEWEPHMTVMRNISKQQRLSVAVRSYIGMWQNEACSPVKLIEFDIFWLTNYDAEYSLDAEKINRLGMQYTCVQENYETEKNHYSVQYQIKNDGKYYNKAIPEQHFLAMR
jgi:hypothetical protein